MAAPRCTRLRPALRAMTAAETSKTSNSSIPVFLAPAFAGPRGRRHAFSTSAPRHSRIGQTPLSTPPDVTFTFTPGPPRPKNRLRASAEELAGSVELVGPLGTLRIATPAFVDIKADEGGSMFTVSVQDAEDGHQRAMWGTIRALIQNQIVGVSEGHSCILRLVGVGFRATVEDKAETKKATYAGQRFVSLKVGYSHPIELGIPAGITASTPQPTRILLQGMEKDKLKHFAAQIREWRRPEPYKGKGIFVDNETIRLKNKKIK